MKKQGGSKDTPGNALASAAAFDRELIKFALVIYRAQDVLERLFEEDIWVQRISISMPNDQRPDYMAYVSAVQGGKKIVGFHGGASLHECLLGTMNRLANGSMKWNPDKWG